MTIQEFGPISQIDISRSEPHYVAVTGSSRVQIFNPLTNEVHKTLTKFKSAAHGGRFRRDGQLIAVGGDDGAVKIFDIASKTLLRLLTKKRDQGRSRWGPSPPNIWNHKNKCVFNKRTVKVCVSCS